MASEQQQQQHVPVVPRWTPSPPRRLDRSGDDAHGDADSDLGASSMRSTDGFPFGSGRSFAPPPFPLPQPSLEITSAAGNGNGVVVVPVAREKSLRRTDEGVVISWEDLWVTASGGGKGGGRVPILCGLNGYARPGEVLAIMGPSGCGKSTLLDALAGRLGSNVSQKGDILINGRRQKLAYGTSAYVTQDDVLMTTLTVREAVHYSAQLQLPSAMSASAKRERAEETLREMGLEGAADTRIGGWMHKGISGGQRRRVSICMEILTRPALLFLDEPTSGLDSAASYHVVAAKEAVVAAVALVAVVLEVGLVGANFKDDCDITWEPQNAKMDEGGNHLTLSLISNSSGSMLRTKKQFIFGSVNTRIKLLKGNSAGTVTTYYTSSIGDNHDEIDFEFLGNETGKPYTVHTNVFAHGVGQKEMQFRPWFDPTADYHNYTIFWNKCMIAWFIDSIPIRVFRNHLGKGVPFPTRRQMYAFSSIWAAEDWATQGGRVKTDWSKAPFVAEYRDLSLRVCDCDDYGGGAGCPEGCASPSNWYAAPDLCELSEAQKKQMRAVQLGYTIYDYCTDANRNVTATPECSMPQY